ncbi:hypothetical protein EJB05_34441, partial [Eragrostis curvula]
LLFRSYLCLSAPAMTAAERLAAIEAHLERCRAVRDEDFSGMTEPERAAEAERRRQEALEEARLTEIRAREQTSAEAAQKMMHRARWHRGRARILDFDPKQEGGVYYNRLYFVDHATFDLDEESPIGPMRYTNRVSKPGQQPFTPCAGLNIFSVRISTSDVGFPIQVYGTVIARDSIDKKCIYLFRRDRDDCQLINSEHDSLMLTGPKRGIVLIDDSYVETNLKIKGHGGQDRELSKGILAIRGIARRYLDACQVERESLATRLSTVDVMYSAVKDAVEATITIEVVQGDFYGEITAHTTSIQNRLSLYNSEVGGCMSVDANGAIQLMRAVISVYVKEKLVIVAKTRDSKDERTIDFTPKLNGDGEGDITVGATKMHVKVTWSIMDF